MQKGITKHHGLVSVLLTIVMSTIQIYACYLLHNDAITNVVLQWLIAVIYLPLYFILLIIGVVIESVIGVSIFRSGAFIPYLKDGAWLMSLPILYPLNAWLLKVGYQYWSRE